LGGEVDARSWNEIRAERPPRKDRVTEHRAQMDAEVGAYVEALGGHLDVVADVGDQKIVLG
jgi:hypothetical protein